ncbi:Cbb3-type cytochrome oxidase, subunit 1 [Luteitalea pratensis]|uniref:Cbb3-type cytochrome oxidase, subunit 1 n=1 Tax=Luteitalea pratensis TaxID=1855912 RepID=A0A143PIK2_LUTPR|nr:hypothetical protein [Luteitalea pratensis]AMY08387.1 Cbb3-type cytochrome oxidase, subunit 1 [Luteitalea pratensis]
MNADPQDAAAGISAGRRALLPAPTLPLAYFGGAHLALAIAFATLLIEPGLAGAFHYHPRLIALVHLVTLGWISGSILGAVYIVAPLALGLPFRARRADATACLFYWLGTAGMVGGFWTGRFAIVGIASLLVLGALTFVGARLLSNLPAARLPRGVSLHLALAFVNIILAGAAGAFMSANRLAGTLPWSPLAFALAHAHLAVLGWATMMIFGTGYRLIPMFLPAAMPSGPGLGISAILLEVGTLWLAASLVAGWSPGPSVLLVMGAFAAFFYWIRRTLRNRRPRPTELPPHDWSTWHTHLAIVYLIVAMALGCWLALGDPPKGVTWAYGATGILFVAQMVSGIQGRLMPMYAWYRALERRDGDLPRQSVHRLIAPSLALSVFLAWLVGLPVLTVGLMNEHPGSIATGSAALLCATLISAAHGVLIIRRAQS